MTSKIWIVKELLSITAEYLKKKEIDSPRLNAEVLLAHVLDADRVQLYLNFDKPLTVKEVDSYRNLIKRRVQREPLQYIVGEQEFWSLNFKVDSSVLIPRPESELLVETAISIFREKDLTENKRSHVLDLGTGSGALAVSLARELKNLDLWATDLSEAVLSIARYNADRHLVGSRIKFVCGDLFEPLEKAGPVFDAIISNPPYVSTGDYETLAPEVRDFEPRNALEGGKEGLYFIEKIIHNAHNYLKTGGWILIEMSPEQTDKALAFFKDAGTFHRAEKIKDYANNYRVVMAKKR